MGIVRAAIDAVKSKIKKREQSEMLTKDGELRCCRLDCEKRATMYPVLELRPTPGITPAQARLMLPLCATCCDLTTVDDLVTQEGWSHILNSFGALKKRPPTRELTTLHFDPIPARPS